MCFFFEKESWLCRCPDTSFFIIYLCCHMLVQNQLTSPHWVYNICKALQYWALWRYIEITHSENVNWQCQPQDVDMTALSISSDITFLPLSPSISTKWIEKSIARNALESCLVFVFGFCCCCCCFDKKLDRGIVKRSHSWSSHCALHIIGFH